MERVSYVVDKSTVVRTAMARIGSSLRAQLAQFWHSSANAHVPLLGNGDAGGADDRGNSNCFLSVSLLRSLTKEVKNTAPSCPSPSFRVRLNLASYPACLFIEIFKAESVSIDPSNLSIPP